jgi:hypothetical protein
MTINDSIAKFQELEINKKYKVVGRKELNTKYGKTYILKVLDDNKYEFKLFSTKYLVRYIDQELPAGPFEFTVKIFKNNIKCPVIDDYSEDDGFISF